MAHVTIKGGTVSVQCKFVVKGISAYRVGEPGGKKNANVANDIEVNYVSAFEEES